MARKRKRRKNSSRTLLGHWKSRGGKYWVKLYENADGSFSIRSDNASAVRYSLDGAMNQVRRMADDAPSKLYAVGRAKRRSNFASGMRYIRNLPPATRKPPYAFTGPPYGGRMPRTKNAPSTHSLTKDQRHLLQWMNRNGAISDGKYTKQNAKTRRVLKQLHRRGFLRKKGRVGQNARYTMTTKGYNALGKVKGVKVKRSRRR